MYWLFVERFLLLFDLSSVADELTLKKKKFLLARYPFLFIICLNFVLIGFQFLYCCSGLMMSPNSNKQLKYVKQMSSAFHLNFV